MNRAKRRRLVVFLMSWGAVAWFASCPARADCIDDAAARHGVNALVLRAMGWHESRLRPAAVGHNRNGSTDIGAFQINSVHLPDLARHGIDATTLADGCASAEVAAWHYRRQVDAFGNTWAAVGAYHSRTPARSAWYANRIEAVLMHWHVTGDRTLPYDERSTLAPMHSAPPPTAGPSAPGGVDSPVASPAGASPGGASFSTLAYLPTSLLTAR